MYYRFMKDAPILTSTYLATLYTAFKQIPPFTQFKLPPASKVKFVITKSKARYGRFDSDAMAIEVSAYSCGHFNTIISVLLHEMTHMALFIVKDPGWARHGTAFWKIKHQYSNMYNLDHRAI